MKRKWMWITITVALALVASFAVTAGSRGIMTPFGPGWSGWCDACAQNETQSYDVRYEAGETCVYAVWIADATRDLEHERLVYCTPGKIAPFGPRK